MTSSMREPVSTSAVAMMVSDPQSSALRAAPKKRRGFSRARVDAAGEDLAAAALLVVVRARHARDRVAEDDHVLFDLDQTARALEDDLREMNVAVRGLVRARGHHFALLDRAAEVGDFLRTLVD